MKTFRHFWRHLAKFFLEWEMFQINVVEKIKTHFMFSDFFPENRAVYEIMRKIWWSQRGNKRRHNMAHTHWMRNKQGYTHAHACIRPRIRAPIRTCDRSHAHTHTHRQICNIYCSSTAPIFTRTLLNVTLYVHCLCCEILIRRVNYRSRKSVQHKGLLYLSIVYIMNTEWRGRSEMCHPYSYWEHKILGVRIFYDINCNRGEGLRPLACWNCVFESRRGHGCLSLVSVVCFQVEVSATGRFLA
jgi:hypothetical protein